MDFGESHIGEIGRRKGDTVVGRVPSFQPDSVLHPLCVLGPVTFPLWPLILLTFKTRGLSRAPSIPDALGFFKVGILYEHPPHFKCPEGQPSHHLSLWGTLPIPVIPEHQSVRLFTRQ